MSSFTEEDLAKQLMSFGEEALQESRVDDAINFFLDTIGINPDLAAAYNNLGVALWEKGDYKSAVENVRTAVEKEPDNPDYFLNYANICFQVRNYKTAYGLLIRAKKQFGELLSFDELNDIDEKINYIQQLIKPDMLESEIYDNQALSDLLTENIFGQEFYSCQNIEEGLLFGPDYLAICCVPHTDARHGNVMLGDYNGGELPIDDLLQKREQLRWENQLNIDNACKGCFLLKKAKWEKKQWLVNRLTVAHYAICDLRCTYCSLMEMTTKERHQAAVQTYDFSKIFDQMIEDKIIGPNAEIEWGGGEPVMFKEFNQVMDRALDYGMKISLLSNSTIKSETIKKGLRSGQITICTSIDAGSPETYLQVRGKNLYNKAWNNIAEYSEIDPQSITAKYIFLDENANMTEVDGFLEKCRLHNIKNLKLSRDINAYNGCKSVDKHDFQPDMIEAIATMGFKAIEMGMNVSFWPAFEDEELNAIKSRIIDKLHDSDCENKQIYVEKLTEELVA